MEYIRFRKRPGLGYYDPATGKKLLSIEGRMNRRGIDQFAGIHDPDKYPACVVREKKNIKAWIDRGDGFIILKMDITELKATAIVEVESARDAVKLTAEEIEDVTADWGVDFESGVTETP